MNLAIRLIQPQDNPSVKDLIISVLQEFGCVGPGFASSDPEIEDMYATYQESDANYWVIVDNDAQTVLGGGGFSRLKGTQPEDGVCELQKLYFRPALRGMGYGKKLLGLIIEEARQAGYREMYLESVPAMKNAIHIYRQFGFQDLSGPKGNTGHHQCHIHMSCSLVAQEAIVS